MARDRDYDRDDDRDDRDDRGGGRKGRKRGDLFDYLDYKDIPSLRRYLSAHGKLYSRKRLRADSQTQRKIALAVKRARFMGILSYTN